MILHFEESVRALVKPIAASRQVRKTACRERGMLLVEGEEKLA
jgi:hypothetical protein